MKDEPQRRTIDTVRIELEEAAAQVLAAEKQSAIAAEALRSAKRRKDALRNELAYLEVQDAIQALDPDLREELLKALAEGAFLPHTSLRLRPWLAEHGLVRYDTDGELFETMRGFRVVSHVFDQAQARGPDAAPA